MRALRRLIIEIAGLAGAGAAFGASPAIPPASMPQTPSVFPCGQGLSPQIKTEWQALGAQSGRLGCPTGPERVSATSPQESGGREANFAGGTIIWHTSGPRAGQVYAVAACYRTYFQFGGPGGWLGLPTSDAENTPDGQRQSFEGGTLTYNRAPDGCEETHSPAPVAARAVAAVGAATPLDLFRAAGGDDYESIAAQNATTRALAAQYARVRTEALVYAEPGADLAPLKLFESATGAHVTVGTLQGERAQGDGATFFGVQGYVLTRPAPGTVPLKQFRNAATGHDMLVASADGEADAKAAGYVFERIEGYATPAPPEPAPPVTPQTSAPDQSAP